MSDFEIEYRFVSLRFFIAGFAVLTALFLFFWVIGSHVDMTVNSEPLIIDFDILLDQNTKHVLFNLNTIPAQVLSIYSNDVEKNYIVIDELKYKENNVMLVFKRNDLKRIVTYNVEELFKSSVPKKQVFEFHQDSWEIQVKDLDMKEASASIRVFIQEEVIPVYDLQDLKNKIRLKKVKQAKDILQSLSGIKSVIIDIFPAFYNRIPVFDSRIKFSIHP